MIDRFRFMDGQELFVPVCDCCERELRAQKTMADAVNEVIASGWTSRRAAVGWSDHCPACEKAKAQGRDGSSEVR